MEIDPNTIAKLAGTAAAGYVGKDLLGKILGPTADYLGEGMRDMVQKRKEQFANILANAKRMLGSHIDEPGSVPPRVLQEILNAGTYCDNELAAEYFGGVLASSRTNLPRDDRGVYFLHLINGMSAYQLRLHYCIYQWIRRAYRSNMGIEPFYKAEINGMTTLRTFVPTKTLHTAMAFTEVELKQAKHIMPECIFVLVQQGLLSKERSRYNDGELKYEPISGGYLFSPTILGVKLFYWAHGFGNVSHRTYLDMSFSIDTKEGIELVLDSVKPMPD